MNRRAIYGIALVLMLPLSAYFLLKGYTDRDVVLPRHYLPDSTITVTKDGKQYTDTVWHKIADFNLTNQQGRQVSWKELEGKVVVANFFFTRCPTICPRLTLNMKELQEGIKNSQKVGSRDPDFIHFLSFSIDPERDSVPMLKNWANRFQVNPYNWWLLTGDKQEIYDLSINEMRIPAEDGGTIDSNFVHTDIFVLIDKNRNVRGYYRTIITDEVNGGYMPDSASLSRLSKDVILLALEKDPNKKFFLAGKLGLIAVVFVIAIILVLLLFRFLKKEQNELTVHSKK